MTTSLSSEGCEACEGTEAGEEYSPQFDETDYTYHYAYAYTYSYKYAYDNKNLF